MSIFQRSLTFFIGKHSYQSTPNFSLKFYLINVLNIDSILIVQETLDVLKDIQCFIDFNKHPMEVFDIGIII